MQFVTGTPLFGVEYISRAHDTSYKSWKLVFKMSGRLGYIPPQATEDQDQTQVVSAIPSIFDGSTKRALCLFIPFFTQFKRKDTCVAQVPYPVILNDVVSTRPALRNLKFTKCDL